MPKKRKKKKKKLPPYILFVSSNFVEHTRQNLNIPFVIRKPLTKILSKLEIEFTELSREETQSRLERAIEHKEIFVTRADVIKAADGDSLMGVMMVLAAMKKMLVSSSGLEVFGCTVIEFSVEIQRRVSPSLTCYLWLSIPKARKAAIQLILTYRKIETLAKKRPVTKNEWEALAPLRDEIAKTGVLGADTNLWKPTIYEYYKPPDADL